MWRLTPSGLPLGILALLALALSMTLSCGQPARAVTVSGANAQVEDYKNFGVPIYGDADIAIGTTDTLILSSDITTSVAGNWDQCITGHVQLDTTNTSAASATLLVRKSSTTGTIVCANDVALPANQSPVLVPVQCCWYDPGLPANSAEYFVVQMSASAASIATAKYKDDGGNGYATYFNQWLLLY